MASACAVHDSSECTSVLNTYSNTQCETSALADKTPEEAMHDGVLTRERDSVSVREQQEKVLQGLTLLCSVSTASEEPYSGGGVVWSSRRTIKNVSILSSCLTGTSSTLMIDAYPPDGMRQCFSIAWKIRQPWSRYLSSPVSRKAMKRDSTVSGLFGHKERESEKQRPGKAVGRTEECNAHHKEGIRQACCQVSVVN
jgi:hypothetical protein